MSTNRERLEAALRQAYRDGIQHWEHARLTRRLLSALGVDPAGTTEPQGTEIGPRRFPPSLANDPGGTWLDYIKELEAEVERLTARVARLEAAGDALADHAVDMHDGDDSHCIRAAAWDAVRFPRDTEVVPTEPEDGESRAE